MEPIVLVHEGAASPLLQRNAEVYGCRLFERQGKSELSAFEISANAPSVFLNYPFWKSAGASRLGVEPADLERCLAAVRAAWTASPRPAPLMEEAVAS